MEMHTELFVVTPVTGHQELSLQLLWVEGGAVRMDVQAKECQIGLQVYCLPSFIQLPEKADTLPGVIPFCHGNCASNREVQEVQ